MHKLKTLSTPLPSVTFVPSVARIKISLTARNAKKARKDLVILFAIFEFFAVKKAVVVQYCITVSTAFRILAAEGR